MSSLQENNEFCLFPPDNHCPPRWILLYLLTQFTIILKKMIFFTFNYKISGSAMTAKK